jgi:NOL1/NOP2/sun family putative RNA methylase
MNRDVVIPADFKARYAKILGKENKKFLKFCKMPLRKSIRINTLKADPDKIIERLKERGWKLQKMPWFEFGYFVKTDEEITSSLEFFLGYIYTQEASSMLPVLALSPEKNDFILDMTAAPGSKTTQMAQIMENKGCIVANDNDIYRIKALRYNIETLGVLNTVVTRMDGVYFKNIKERFDRVLIDAPCSAEGNVRKSWNVLSRWSVNLIKHISEIQKRLICAGIECLKKDGVLVYSTCTLAPEENEGVIDYALKKYDNVFVEDFGLSGFKTRPGLLEWGGMKYDDQIRNCKRIWPQDNDTQGFFIARLRKK